MKQDIDWDKIEDIEKEINKEMNTVRIVWLVLNGFIVLWMLALIIWTFCYNKTKQKNKEKKLKEPNLQKIKTNNHDKNNNDSDFAKYNDQNNQETLIERKNIYDEDNTD